MKKIVLLAAVVFVLETDIASSQCREAGPIRVAKGQRSAIVTGTVSAARAVCYKIRARQGQTIDVRLTSPNRTIKFSIVPDAYDVDYNYADSRTRWTGRVDGAYGDNYIISIHADRGSGRYSLTMTFR